MSMSQSATSCPHLELKSLPHLEKLKYSPYERFRHRERIHLQERLLTVQTGLVTERQKNRLINELHAENNCRKRQQHQNNRLVALSKRKFRKLIHSIRKTQKLITFRLNEEKDFSFQEKDFDKCNVARQTEDATEWRIHEIFAPLRKRLCKGVKPPLPLDLVQTFIPDYVSYYIWFWGCRPPDPPLVGIEENPGPLTKRKGQLARTESSERLNIPPKHELQAHLAKISMRHRRAHSVEHKRFIRHQVLSAHPAYHPTFNKSKATSNNTKKLSLGNRLDKLEDIPIGMPIMYTQTLQPLMKLLKPRTGYEGAIIKYNKAHSDFVAKRSRSKSPVRPVTVSTIQSESVDEMIEYRDPIPLEVNKQLFYMWERVRRPKGYQGEIKRVDGVISSTSLTASGAVGIIFNIPQGDGEGERVGDRVFLKSIKMRITIVAANADVFSLANMFIAIWIPNVSLDSPNIGYFKLNSSTVAQSYQNYTLYQNYHMLWDWHKEFTGTSTVPTTGSAHTFPIDIKLNYMMTYLTASSSASSRTLFLGYSSDSAAPPYPAFSATGTLKYTDA